MALQGCRLAFEYVDEFFFLSYNETVEANSIQSSCTREMGQNFNKGQMVHSLYNIIVFKIMKQSNTKRQNK